MLTFAEEIVLLILDDETGKLANAGSPSVNHALAGAVLMDLALRSKIDTDLEKLVWSTVHQRVRRSLIVI